MGRPWKLMSQFSFTILLSKQEPGPTPSREGEPFSITYEQPFVLSV
jgi:hypothetical protein